MSLSFITKILLLPLGLIILFGGVAAAIASPQARPLGTLYNGTPSNYRTLLSGLQAGDTLLLEAGAYTRGLPVENLNGTAANPIINMP
jgi:hypothetical protein